MCTVFIWLADTFPFQICPKNLDPSHKIFGIVLEENYLIAKLDMADLYI